MMRGLKYTPSSSCPPIYSRIIPRTPPILGASLNKKSTNVDTGGELVVKPAGRFLDDGSATMAIGSLP
jgi:hypothetical protein